VSEDGPEGVWLLAGRYRVDGTVGRGGMSVVWHGYDERLDRRVAIKRLLPTGPVPADPDSPEALEIADDLERDRQRFLREIRTMARLELPGIPAVYDAGVDAKDNRLYLVMQLLSGSTLSDLIRSRDYAADPPPVGWAAAIGAQIAATLADVHRVDVVHRDIKADNVMLVDGGLVKVLDFGIALLKGAGALPRLTQLDKTVGTPPYMSPEQSNGRPVGPPSDVYALGCLLYQLLTGRYPYLDDSRSTFRELHTSAPIPSVRARRPDLPVEIDALISAMLAKQPADRPDAGAVYGALLPYARTAPADRSASKVASASGSGSERDPSHPFIRPLADAGRRAARIAVTTEPLTDAEGSVLLERAQQLAEADQPQQAIELLEDGIERARHDAPLTLSLRHALASVLFYADEHTRAAPLFDSVGREFARQFGNDDPIVVECSGTAEPRRCPKRRCLKYRKLPTCCKALGQASTYDSRLTRTAPSPAP
jgi:serine/threonine protein kinase